MSGRRGSVAERQGARAGQLETRWMTRHRLRTILTNFVFRSEDGTRRQRTKNKQLIQISIESKSRIRMTWRPIKTYGAITHLYCLTQNVEVDR